MTTTGQNVKIYAGNTRRVTFVVSDDSGAPIPSATLAAGTVRWWAGKDVKARANPFIKKGTDEALTPNKITFPGADGEITFKLNPDDTKSVRADTDFYAECEFIDGVGNVSTLATGKLKVKATLIPET
jgi:hypothetical protein